MGNLQSSKFRVCKQSMVKSMAWLLKLYINSINNGSQIVDRGEQDPFMEDIKVLWRENHLLSKPAAQVTSRMSKSARPQYNTTRIQWI